jgi:hypothetical protein
LKAVDWTSMRHSRGPAVEIPGLLEAIRLPEAWVRRQAYQKLADLLVHQTTPAEVCPAAVPFLIDLVADESAPDRFGACQVLRLIAVPDQSLRLDAGPGEGGPGEGEAFDAVRAGIGVYLRALRAADPAVRLYAAFLLAWFPADRDVIVPELSRVIAGDDDPEVVAAACVAAGLCGRGGDDPALIEALKQHWGDPSALLGLALARSRPDPALAHDLYDCLSVVGPTPNWPFLDGDMETMTAFVIAGLPPDLAPGRVDALLSRLSEGRELDDFPFALTLLKAAFPAGGVPDGTVFAELSPPQQRALAVLAADPRIHRGAMISMLLARYNLPPGDELPAWCR